MTLKSNLVASPQFGQITDYQEHGGAVSTSTTPRVAMSYADGNANTIRPTSITYPNGRVVTYSYGTSGEIDDVISRISPLVDSDVSSTAMAGYSFMGLRRVKGRVIASNRMVK